MGNKEWEDLCTSAASSAPAARTWPLAPIPLGLVWMSTTCEAAARHGKVVKGPAIPVAAPQGRRHQIPPSSDAASPLLPCNWDKPSCTTNM